MKDLEEFLQSLRLAHKGEDCRQLDAVLPGYTLKSQLDILSLLKQVGLGEKGLFWEEGTPRAERTVVF